MRTSAFPLMYLSLVFVAAASLLAIGYVAGLAAASGLAPAVAALALSLLAVVNGTGRALASRISDRFGRRRTLTAVLALEGAAHIGILYSARAGNAAAFLAFAGLIGLGGGAFYPLFASLVADYFGERDAVHNFGIVYSAKLFGGVLGIGVPALLVSSSGFTIPFLAAGLLSVFAALMTRLLRRPGYPTLPLPRQVRRTTSV